MLARSRLQKSSIDQDLAAANCNEVNVSKRRQGRTRRGCGGEKKKVAHAHLDSVGGCGWLRRRSGRLGLRRRLIKKVSEVDGNRTITKQKQFEQFANINREGGVQ